MAQNTIKIDSKFFSNSTAIEFLNENPQTVLWVPMGYKDSETGMYHCVLDDAVISGPAEYIGHLTILEKRFKWFPLVVHRKTVHEKTVLVPSFPKAVARFVRTTNPSLWDKLGQPTHLWYDYHSKRFSAEKPAGDNFANFKLKPQKPRDMSLSGVRKEPLTISTLHPERVAAGLIGRGGSNHKQFVKKYLHVAGTFAVVETIKPQDGMTGCVKVDVFGSDPSILTKMCMEIMTKGMELNKELQDVPDEPDKPKPEKPKSKAKPKRQPILERKRGFQDVPPSGPSVGGVSTKPGTWTKVVISKTATVPTAVVAPVPVAEGYSALEEDDDTDDDTDDMNNEAAKATAEATAEVVMDDGEADDMSGPCGAAPEPAEESVPPSTAMDQPHPDETPTTPTVSSTDVVPTAPSKPKKTSKKVMRKTAAKKLDFTDDSL